MRCPVRAASPACFNCSATSPPLLLLTPPAPATPAHCLQLDPGLWEVCLQDYGIYRQSAICGKYLTV